MLAAAIAFELLEPIPRRHSEVIELFRRVYGHELAEHEPVEGAREAPDGLSREQPLRVPVREALNHLE